MPATVQKACKQCSMVVDGENTAACPNCGGQLSKEWQGYVVIVDHTKSEIAKKMGITTNGKFALRVR